MNLTLNLTFDEIVDSEPEALPAGEPLGKSREDRPIRGYRLGCGAVRISLIAGCHADEPVGPLLLRSLVSCLSRLPAAHAALAGFDWWIVSHANPDGLIRNRAWIEELGARADPVSYLQHVQRELPGDDVEFGFPRGDDDDGARPENRAIRNWWRRGGAAFHLHASLHGMSLAHGPWFLVEAAWRDRTELFQERCREAVAALGYRLHDVDRAGDKGFVRIGPGFTTRPDSREMARYFRARGDEETAALFRPSSMETVRDLGGDPLTLVSEMPLFLLPPSASDAPATSGDLDLWRTRLAAWKQGLAGGRDPDLVRREIADAGIEAMPVRDQMRLQWAMILAGIDQVHGATA